MKKTILLFALVATTLASFGQTKPPVKNPATTAKPVVSKFGALAIDRSSGFYYGWSFDHATSVEAEKRAIEECTAKGGNCTVVLTYSGTGCAAYRTVDGNAGTAFGWGLAKTKEEADAIATKECLKRSNGKLPANFVWSCNSTTTGTLKEIYNASEEIEAQVKVGTQIWSNRNLDVSIFRNGDPIPEAKNAAEWQEFCIAEKACFVYLNFDPESEKKYGKLYNFYAVKDQRKLAPSGWHIPQKNEYQELIDYLGGEDDAGKKMKSTTGWNIADKKLAGGNGTNESGLNFLAGGMAQSNEYDKTLSPLEVFSNKYFDVGWWSSTEDPTTTFNGFVFKFYTSGVTAITASEYPTRGFSVRPIKD